MGGRIASMARENLFQKRRSSVCVNARKSNSSRLADDNIININEIGIEDLPRRSNRRSG
jgi:hypothetical protein